MLSCAASLQYVMWNTPAVLVAWSNCRSQSVFKSAIVWIYWWNSHHQFFWSHFSLSSESQRVVQIWPVIRIRATDDGGENETCDTWDKEKALSFLLGPCVLVRVGFSRSSSGLSSSVSFMKQLWENVFRLNVFGGLILHWRRRAHSRHNACSLSCPPLICNTQPCTLNPEAVMCHRLQQGKCSTRFWS